ncbi:hypothetical protein GQ457_02G031480 [Hibiscus cannabinus]
MEAEEGDDITIVGRAEIDTQPPFRSVKEAVICGKLWQQARRDESSSRRKRERGIKDGIPKVRARRNAAKPAKDQRLRGRQLNQLRQKEFQKQRLEPDKEDFMFIENATKNQMKSLQMMSSRKKASKPPLSLNLHRRPSKPISFSTKATPIYAAIFVGDKLPEAALSYFDSDGELQTTRISSLTAGKKDVLFAVPGAFTPTCSQKHLPGFVEKSWELKAKGVDAIACISVNDAFVMRAWKENLGINDEVLLLSDGNGEFTKKIGCEMDLSDKPVGLGVHSRRYALLVEDGVVKLLNFEEGGAFTFSAAEDILKVL